jgi:hypothetical protein
MADNKNMKRAQQDAENELTKGFVEEQTSFPPYWQPEEGKMFVGRVLALDERDPAFSRFIIQAMTPCDCARGPAKDAEEVKVSPGDQFSISVYSALPLHLYLGEVVEVTAKGLRSLRNGNDLWEFRLRCSPETKAIANKRRAALPGGSTQRALPRSDTNGDDAGL